MRKTLLLLLPALVLLSWLACASADTLALPDNTLAIAEEAFAGDRNIEDVFFPEGLKEIGPRAFAQCGLRYDYVEGTDSSPVGYLEGVFVSEGYRRRGYAAELISQCEAWAKEKGCREFASDCELANHESLEFHMAVGFEEVNRVICFRKELN